MSTSKSSQEEFYRGLWSNPRWSGPESNKNEQARWEAVETLLQSLPEAPSSILDLGCGRGWLTRLLADKGSVVGIDPLKASIEQARGLFPGLKFRRARARDLLADVKSPRFDLIVSSEVIEHVPNADKPAFLSATYQLLKPNGHLILTTPRGELWPAWSARATIMQPVEDWLREDELEYLARQCGFLPVARRRAHPPRRPLTWQGTLLQRVFLRRFVRDLPLGALRRFLADRASMYQAWLLRKTEIS